MWCAASCPDTSCVHRQERPPETLCAVRNLHHVDCRWQLATACHVKCSTVGHRLGQRLLELIPALRLGDSQVHHHFFDAPALGSHLELQLRRRQALDLIVEPGFSVISSCATRRWRSPGVIGSAKAGWTVQVSTTASAAETCFMVALHLAPLGRGQPDWDERRDNPDDDQVRRRSDGIRPHHNDTSTVTAMMRSASSRWARPWRSSNPASSPSSCSRRVSWVPSCRV